MSNGMKIAPRVILPDRLRAKQQAGNPARTPPPITATFKFADSFFKAYVDLGLQDVVRGLNRTPPPRLPKLSANSIVMNLERPVL